MLNTILSLGESALSNFQAALNIHSGNLANLGVEGYARRTVNMQTDDLSLTREPTYGAGVTIQSITRNLNAFIERQYVSQIADTSYWESVQESLSGLDTLFNDVDGVGVSSALDALFDSFVELTAGASDSAVRSQTLEAAEQLALMLNTLTEDLDSLTSSLDSAISDQVNAVNSLLTSIAELNKNVASQPDNLALLDRRDQQIKELAQLIDITIIEDDNGQVRVLTKEGQSLVNGDRAYSLRLDGPKSVAALSPGSAFDGQIYFEGDSSHELTLEFISSGDCVGGATAATFKISLDGGKTYVTDEDDNPMIYTAGDVDNKVVVDGVSIWFGTETDPNIAPATDISVNDRFTVIPKTGLYWITTTGGAVNVTPLEGNDSLNRLSGGSLAGLFSARDEYVGEYQDRMDALARNLIWEVNYAHSQGAGLEHYSSTLGEYAAEYTDQPLAESLLEYADKLESGSLSLALYDSSTGDNLSVTALDFSSVAPGTVNFDPSIHSLEDVRDAINATFAGQVTATIHSGRLKLEAASGVEFSFAGDSTGLLAALGLNTLFTGSTSADIAVDADILADHSHLNTAHVNGAGEVATGDNTTASALAELDSKTVTLKTIGGSTQATLAGYLGSLSALVGQDLDSAAFNLTYAQTLEDNLARSSESVSGVSMDEELTKILQYQQYYEAAAKLIQTAQDMFDVVLSLK